MGSICFLTQWLSLVNKKLTREAKREQRLGKLKLAATEIFAEQGYHATKISQIVSQVGVAQGTFYLYYEGKKPLFGELLSDFLALLVKTMTEWRPAKLENFEILERELQGVGLQLTTILLKEKELTKIFFREGIGIDPEFDKIVHDFYCSVYTLLSAFAETLWKRGFIEKMNFQLLAIQTIGTAERVIEEYIVNETIVDTEPEEVVRHLVLTWLHGTRKPIETKH